MLIRFTVEVETDDCTRVAKCIPAPVAPKFGKGESKVMFVTTYPLFEIPAKTQSDITKITFHYQSEGEAEKTMECADLVATPEAPIWFDVTPDVPGKAWWTETEKSGLVSNPSPVLNYSGKDETPPKGVTDAPNVGKGETKEIPDPTPA